MRLRGLYAITPAWTDSARVMDAVSAALDGGASAVQFRRKHLAGATLLDEAQSMASLCRSRGVPFFVNDDPLLALACSADGVHLGRNDGDVAQARELLGPGKLIGVSCYGDIGRVQAAEVAGADYVAIGSLFPSGSKPEAQPASLATLTQAKLAIRIPLVGIGGITRENAGAVKLAGADMIAVIGALFESDSVRETASFFSAMWEGQDVQSE
ncbi:MAG: thiamine phosphate synthase [Burkholderiales bacterium]|nr:thiamine phosphate synthase [Burkholderiales bacterium]